MPQGLKLQQPPSTAGLPQLPADDPNSSLAQLTDFLAGMVGGKGFGPGDSHASTYGAGAAALLGAPGVMAILKAVKPGQAAETIQALKDLANKLAPLPVRSALTNWGTYGNTEPLTEEGSKLLSTLQANPSFLEDLSNHLAAKFPNQDTVPVYRGMQAPFTKDMQLRQTYHSDPESWIQPRPGPTSFTLSPAVAKRFGNTVIGAQVPKTAILGTPPNFSEQELIVNMNPDLWNQTKVLRTPETSVARAAKQVAQKAKLPANPNSWDLAQKYPSTMSTKELTPMSYVDELKQTGKPAETVSPWMKNTGFEVAEPATGHGYEVYDNLDDANKAIKTYQNAYPKKTFMLFDHGQGDWVDAAGKMAHPSTVPQLGSGPENLPSPKLNSSGNYQIDDPTFGHVEISPEDLKAHVEWDKANPNSPLMNDLGKMFLKFASTVGIK